MGSLIIVLIIGIGARIAIGYFFLKANMLKDSMPKDELDKRYILKELYNETTERLRETTMNLK
jgi:hypothetical protein